MYVGFCHVIFHLIYCSDGSEKPGSPMRDSDKMMLDLTGDLLLITHSCSSERESTPEGFLFGDGVESDRNSRSGIAISVIDLK